MILSVVDTSCVGHHQDFFQAVEDIAGPDHRLEVMQVLGVEDDEIAIFGKSAGHGRKTGMSAEQGAKVVQAVQLPQRPQIPLWTGLPSSLAAAAVCCIHCKEKCRHSPSRKLRKFIP